MKRRLLFPLVLLILLSSFTVAAIKIKAVHATASSCINPNGVPHFRAKRLPAAF